MERQFTRFDDIDHRFDVMDKNLMNLMEKQAGVGGTMNNLSDKISALMAMIAQVHIQTGNASAISISTSEAAINATAHTMSASNQESSVTFNSSNSRQQDRSSFSSPIKKKYRVGLGSKDSEDNAEMDNKDNTDVCKGTPFNEEQESNTRDNESLQPDSLEVRTSTIEENHMESQPTIEDFEEIITDLESRYNAQSSHGGGSTT